MKTLGEKIAKAEDTILVLRERRDKAARLAKEGKSCPSIIKKLDLLIEEKRSEVNTLRGRRHNLGLANPFSKETLDEIVALRAAANKIGAAIVFRLDRQYNPSGTQSLCYTLGSATLKFDGDLVAIASPPDGKASVRGSVKDDNAGLVLPEESVSSFDVANGDGVNASVEGIHRTTTKPSTGQGRKSKSPASIKQRAKDIETAFRLPVQATLEKFLGENEPRWVIFDNSKTVVFCVGGYNSPENRLRAELIADLINGGCQP